MTVLSDRYWDQLYQNGQYRVLWECDLASPELVGLVASGVVGKSAHILDLGCGSGRDAIFLAGQGLQVTAVDLSATALALGQAAATEQEVIIDWRVGSATDIPLDDHTFDWVLDRGCFHHVLPAHRQRYADELFRVLRPGGKVFLRGAASSQPPFLFALNASSVEQAFDCARFERGPLLPISLVSRHQTLAGYLVILQRRAD